RPAKGLLVRREFRGAERGEVLLVERIREVAVARRLRPPLSGRPDNSSVAVLGHPRAVVWALLRELRGLSSRFEHRHVLEALIAHALRDEDLHLVRLRYPLSAGGGSAPDLVEDLVERRRRE